MFSKTCKNIMLICLFICSANISNGQNWILIHQAFIDVSRIIKVNNERTLFFQTWGATGAPFLGCDDTTIYCTYKLNAGTNRTFKPLNGFFEPTVCMDPISTESCFFYKPLEFDVSNQDSGFAIKYIRLMTGTFCTPPELNLVVTPAGNSNQFRAEALRISPFNDNIIYSVINDSLYKSVNRGSDWYIVQGTQGNLNDVAFNPFDENYIYLITSQNSLLISTDNGLNFNQTGSNFSSSGELIFKSQDKILTYNGSNVYTSYDKGLSWNQLGSAPGIINCLEFHPTRHEIYYAGIGSDIYVSSNGGVDFTIYNNTLPGNRIYGILKARPDLDSIYIVGDTGLFLVYDQYITNITQISSVIPELYILYDNYPNPFNPGTKIKYSIPVSGYIVLKIYDALGNEVSTLVDEMQRAGTYEVEFSDAGYRELASGVYFYRLEAEGFTYTKRMVLIK